jgi:hypothetical protein
MKKNFYIALIVLLLSCSKQNSENNSRYSAEQVASLKIDSTKIIRVQTDSIIKIDLNPFLKKNDINFAERREKILLSPSYFAVTPGGYLFYSVHGADNRHLGSLSEHQIFITDKQFRLKSAGFPYQYSKENNYEGDRYINLFDKSINFTFKFTNTIYQYSNDSTVKAKYAIDISDKEVPSQIIKESSADDFFTEVRQNNYYFFMGEYVENIKHDFFILENWYIRDYTFIFRDKNSGNIRVGTVLKNGPEVFPIINTPIASRDSCFISYFIPQYTAELKNLLSSNIMLSKEDKIKIRNLQEEDNPVLMFYELKPF